MSLFIEKSGELFKFWPPLFFALNTTVGPPSDRVIRQCQLQAQDFADRFRALAFAPARSRTKTKRMITAEGPVPARLITIPPYAGLTQFDRNRLVIVKKLA